MRKPLAVTVAGLLGIVMLLGLVPRGAPVASGAQKGPIKVGLLAPLTGPFAANGKDMVSGIQLFLEEQGYRLAGREVKVLVEDDEGKPTTGLAKARALVETHGVQVLLGPLSAAVGYAVAPYIESKKLPTILPIAASEDLTQRKRSPYIVRTGWSSAQPSHPFGQFVHELGYKKVAMIGYDYAFGWEVAAGFQRTFEEAGGLVVLKLWTPLDTQDFGPYLAKLPSNVDAVYAVFSGADALRFVKQYAEAGPSRGGVFGAGPARVPLIGAGTLTDEHVLRVMGNEALTILTALHYSAALATPANRKFVRAYEARFQQRPSYYAEGTYVAGMALRAALEAVGGDVEAGDKVLAALRRVELSEAPRGPIRLDAYGNPVQNIYMRKVQRVNDQLQNTVLRTVPNVSQFWTYKPEDYLAKPVYSRDYPPCKSC